MTKETYRWLYLNQLNTYFLWKSEEIEILHLLEIVLRERGLLGYDLVNKCWVVANPSGTLDKNNEFEEFKCWTFNTTEKEFYTLKNHSEVVILWNNALGQSDLPIINYFSEMASETDTSVYYQLVNSRNIPILQVETDAQKKEIERALHKIEAGKPAIVTTKTMEGIKTVDILDPNAISKMECLSSFNEVIEKRRINIFGASLDMKDKKAQVTSTELKSYDDITTISFLTNYECRLKFCEEMAENGISIECIRNPIFADEPTEEDINAGTFEAREEEIQEEQEQPTEEGGETNEENPDNA